MKIGITVYADSTYEATLIINALKTVRTQELDTFLAGKTVDDQFNQKAQAASDAPDVVVKTARANVSPGEPGITKIGKDTAAQLLDNIRAGNEIFPKFAEHLKLLWKRGEVCFDGKEYYLP